MKLPIGGTWAPDNTIIFGSIEHGLQRVVDLWQPVAAARDITERERLLAREQAARAEAACATTFFQNQVDSRLKTFIRSNQLTKIPAKAGIMSAQRKGLLRAHAEHSSSQPTVGSAHSA